MIDRVIPTVVIHIYFLFSSPSNVGNDGQHSCYLCITDLWSLSVLWQLDQVWLYCEMLRLHGDYLSNEYFFGFPHLSPHQHFNSMSTSVL